MKRQLPCLGLGILLACSSYSTIASAQLQVETRANPLESLRTQADYHERLPIPGRDDQPEVDVDITGVLYHRQQGNHQAAQNELTRLQAEHPRWQPPKALSRILQQARISDPEQRYLSLMAELANTPEDAVGTLAETRLREATIGVRQRKDAYHAMILGWLYFQRRDYPQAESLFLAAGDWGEVPASRRALGLLAERQAQQAARADDYLLAQHYAGQAVALGNNDSFINTAWLLYEAEKYQAAAEIFAMHHPRNEAALFGETLARRSAGEPLRARQLACEYETGSARLLEICIDLIAAEMVHSYQSGQHTALSEQAAVLQQMNALPPDLLALLAWSTLQAGQHQAAAEHFQQLLRLQADNHSHAHGLIESLLRSDDPAALAIARTQHPRVEEILAQREAIQAGHLDPDGSLPNDNGRQLAHAVALYQNGDYEKAWMILDQQRELIQRDRDSDMLVLTGWAAFHSERPLQARDSFLLAMQWSDDPAVPLMLAEAEIALGNLQQANELLAIQVPSAQREAMQDRILLLMAGAASEDGDPARAEALLLSSERPLNPPAMELLGWSQYQQGKYRQASTQFESAYRLAPSESRARGLVFSYMQGSDPRPLINLASELQGPLLGLTNDPQVHQELAAGRDNWISVSSDGELIVVEPEPQRSEFAQALQQFIALPGSTWGSVDHNLRDQETYVSLLINQGIDWTVLPGEITVNTFFEYRAIHNDWQAIYDDDEVVFGAELQRAPFKLGIEYAPARWRGTEGAPSTTNAYLGWYHSWYHFLRRRGSTSWNPLDVDAYDGAVYGRVIHNLDEDITTARGFVRQGMDWFTADTWAGEITLNTYAAYRYRLRTRDAFWYNAHGPAIGVELNRSPFSLGIDYMRQYNPRRSTAEHRYGIYLTWYYDWNLRPE
ncbi:MAG: hypothetical protein IBX49_07530 [Gammaproteobacteria bacterium]|nr:hypothetical protein [Gammaproteobacteria bacterium]